MAFDLPPDLVQLRRDFLAAEERLRAIGQAQPAPTAVAAGEAEVSDEQRVEWAAAFDETRRLAEEIHRHPWWLQVDQRHDAWMALQKAALLPMS
jgi:hypothetical protein